MKVVGADAFQDLLTALPYCESLYMTNDSCTASTPPSSTKLVHFGMPKHQSFQTLGNPADTAFEAAAEAALGVTTPLSPTFDGISNDVFFLAGAH